MKNLLLSVLILSISWQYFHLTEAKAVSKRQSCGGRGCNVGCGGGDCPYVDEDVEEEPRRCCDVLHPKQCFTEETGNRRCVIKRHRECSNLCTSPVVSIRERKRAPSRCHYIRNYPYAYCGNYERQDCGQSNCEEIYDRPPRRPGCSGSCDDEISPVY